MKPLAIAIFLSLLATNIVRADFTDLTMCPPAWSDSLIYYQSFDTADGRPEVNLGHLQERDTLLPAPGGIRRRCGMPAATGKHRQVQLVSNDLVLSPHKPLTISIWWSLPQDLPPQGGFDLIQLHGRGFISHFARGGPWCGLKETAGVLQVYHFPNINNVNGIYDQSLPATLGLKKGQWHHCAMVITGASLITIFTDGKPAFECRTAGRPFTPEDGLKTLSLGGSVFLDEIMVLRKATSAEEIAEYFFALRQMHQAYTPEMP